MKNRVKNFAIIYSMYYRSLSSQLTPKFIMTPTLKDETVILQVEADKPTVYTPKRLKWNEITISTEFQIENPQVPRNLERIEAEQLIEEPDGKIFIKFPSYRERPSISSNFSWMPARQSCSDSIEFVSSIEII